MLLSYSLVAQEGNYSFTESFKVAEPVRLDISAEDGNIEMLASNQSNVKVHYIVKV